MTVTEQTDKATAAPPEWSPTEARQAFGYLDSRLFDLRSRVARLESKNKTNEGLWLLGFGVVLGGILMMPTKS
jgi:hypothetical protein